MNGGKSLSAHDVGIVGAGPAGAWAAYRLASAGARVVIFDASHPREKPCGGGVTGRALALVGPAIANLAPSVPIENVLFESEDGRRASVPLNGGHGGSAGISTPLVVVPRTAFDRALLDAAIGAGATWIGERVREVTLTASGATLSTARGTRRCDWVIGADGATSLVRRRVWRPFSRSQLSIATGFYAAGQTSRDIVLAFTAHPPGYIWSFPRTDHLALGICAQANAADAASLRGRLEAWMRRNRVADGASLRPYGWPIPSLDVGEFESERMAGSRWLLVGDAAGLVDPITREGIFFALESGAHAAVALAGRRPDAEYMDRIRESTVQELEIAARVKRMFFRPDFSRLLVAALVRSAGIGSVMADLVAGTQPYATLARRLFGTLEIGLAWRVFRMARGGPRC